jgi:hypothetical protein
VRALVGVGHFWNLVSNLPFLVIGLMGLRATQRPAIGAARLEWRTVFAGAVLVSFGSAYYHLAPSDARLVWDRVPIAIAFMGFFSALVAENIDARLGRRMLAPALAFGFASIYWWRATGDLSAWIWVQAAPMLAIALVLGLFPARHSHRRYMAYALACYVAAKLLELADRALMDWTGGLISGHTLKHLAAAAGVWCFYAMLVNRASRRSP